ncbi:MAG TPA: HAD hydrolase-like protein, partial [Candidatus Limadaptatus stercorigallinarum]|nr:HAD hydrolase-like protein [Candidatus Limadaptatus stercorigallinarum]
KPAPDSVNEILRALDVPREAAVYVGDSDVDADTARNAGVDFVGVGWGFRPHEVLAAHGAEIIVESAAELLAQILRD